MRKTKTPRRSRLIRKWDGTPVGEATMPSTVPTETEPSVPALADHTVKNPEFLFESNHEDELSDTLDN